MIKINKSVNNIIGGNMFQISTPLIILFIFLAFIIALLLSKIKIEITMENELYIDAYIFEYIRVKRFRLSEDELKEVEDKSKTVVKDEINNYFKKVRLSDLKIFLGGIIKLSKNVRVKKLDFDLNINLNDYILNAYIVTLVNSIVATLISSYIDHINTDDLSYAITSNEKNTKLKLKCIVYGNFANIILVLIKVVKYAFKLKKRGNEENGKGTSNRKFDGNSDDIARSNG